jgi:uncharacterized protein YuzE
MEPAQRRTSRRRQATVETSDRPMKIEYFPDTDTLSILMTQGADYMEGEDTNDPDVTLLYDRDNRLAEIVVEHASRRVDLDQLRHHASFEVVTARSEAR